MQRANAETAVPPRTIKIVREHQVSCSEPIRDGFVRNVKMPISKGMTHRAYMPPVFTFAIHLPGRSRFVISEANGIVWSRPLALRVL